MAGNIRIGVGGWTFEPWRGVFYPRDVKQKDELAYASRHLTAIEINGTYYSTFKPDSWKKWRDETPDGFVFAVKGSRFTTNRRELAGAGESLERYFGQGVAELGERLGPILWQLPHTKKFDAADLEGFFSLLPKELNGITLRHALEPRHDSFCNPAYPALLRKHGIANVYARHNQLSGDRRPFDRLRLRPPADRRGQRRDRLSASRARRLGRAPEDLVRRRRAGRPAARRQGLRRPEDAARRVRLHHPRGQDPGAGGRHGADRAGGLMAERRPPPPEPGDPPRSGWAEAFAAAPAPMTDEDKEWLEASLNDDEAWTA